MWKFVDSVITAPAWIVGYFITSYKLAARRGRRDYITNTVKHRYDNGRLVPDWMQQ